MEVLRFNDTPKNEQVLADFVGSAVVHPLDEAVVQRTIALARLSKIKLPDAIIAATALLEDRTLVTRNVDDYTRTPGLSLLCPWNIT
jgi:predicted nucleic acid-binding protein